MLKQIKSVAPSYLNVFIDYELITIFFYELLKENKDDFLEQTMNSLDLTGNPMKVDLGTTSDFQITPISAPQNWSSEENTKSPLTLNEARRIVNEYLKKKSNEAEETVFCVCNGDNMMKTVLSGFRLQGSLFTRYLCNVLPCMWITKLDKDSKLDFIKERYRMHEPDCLKCSVIHTKWYYTNGFNLKNINLLENADYSNSFCIKTKYCDTEKRETYKLNIQAIIGHSQSPLNDLWNDFKIIVELMNVMENFGSNSKITLSGDEQNLHKISNMIIEALNFQYEASDNSEFVEGIWKRTPNLIDNLWKTLQKSSDLEILKDCLDLIFNQIKENSLTGLQSKSTSFLEYLIAGIVHQTILIDSFDTKQALYFLIDLGMEKLKNDYAAILNFFKNSFHNYFIKLWNEYFDVDIAIIKKIPGRRSEFNAKIPVNIWNQQNKLDLLQKIHHTLEILLALKQNSNFLAVNVIDKLKENIFECFTQQNISDFRNKSVYLIEFDNFPSTINNYTLESLFPLDWSIQLKSGENSQATYHFSESPIFPPIIFNNYEGLGSSNPDESQQKKMKYVTEFVEIIN